MTSSVSMQRPADIAIGQAFAARLGDDRAIVGFASLQFFTLIYLQKFALFPPAFSLSVPMLVMFASIGWMIISRNLTIVVSRLAIFLLFFGFCLFSEAINQGSVTSFAQLVLLYICMIVRADLSDMTYRKILDRFISFMILPAFIVFVQYAYQKYTGLSDPFNLERLFPKSILMPGFIYNAPYPWYSTFSRPNGFFFLEPSFVSAFLASAAILEITYFFRPWCVILMCSATFLSLGATGIMMLVIAAPILIFRKSPKFVIVAAILVAVAIAAAYLLGIRLPVLSRVDEFNDPKSSSSDRMLFSAIELLRWLADPASGWLGYGAGSSPLMQVWPMVKLLHEFGPLAMISFLALYIVGMARSVSLALRVVLSVVYHFTGGYLLSPTIVELIIMLCFILVPNARLEEPHVDPHAARQRAQRRPLPSELVHLSDGG